MAQVERRGSEEPRWVTLSEGRIRQILAPADWVDGRSVGGLAAGLAVAITALVALLDVPGSLELRGWLAVAFVGLPGVAVGLAVATVGMLGLRDPALDRHGARFAAIRQASARALAEEIAAGARAVRVEQHRLALRQAWLLEPTAEGDPPIWVVAGDTHAAVLAGDLPSVQLDRDALEVPRSWQIERLPLTSGLLDLRASGSSLPLTHGAAPMALREGHCAVVPLEQLPVELARVTTGLGAPYRGH